MDKISYALGLSVGSNLAEAGVKDLSVSDFSAGLSAVLSGAKSELSTDEAQRLLSDYFRRLTDERSAEARAAGEKFLAENARREGVTVLPSGLQYQVLTPAIAPKPKPTDRVRVHYHGTLIDGTVFDSSVRRGEPAVFGVTQVIPGWVEALQLMSVGSKWRLFIPQHLAYGAQGAGASIPPYSTLIFDVELLGIEK